MRFLAQGLGAGFVATVVLSALMLLKSAVGLMPELNVIEMLTRMAGSQTGISGTPVIGWLLHFVIGTVLWGGIFALVWPRWPGNNATFQGVIFSAFAWLLMMVVMMPLAGAGFFGMSIGLGAPVATLVLHIIFGAVLGAVFGWLIRPGKNTETSRSDETRSREKLP